MYINGDKGFVRRSNRLAALSAAHQSAGDALTKTEREKQKMKKQTEPEGNKMISFTVRLHTAGFTRSCVDNWHAADARESEARNQSDQVHAYQHCEHGAGTGSRRRPPSPAPGARHAEMDAGSATQRTSAISREPPLIAGHTEFRSQRTLKRTGARPSVHYIGGVHSGGLGACRAVVHRNDCAS